jgi:hypothetical protein
MCSPWGRPVGNPPYQGNIPAGQFVAFPTCRSHRPALVRNRGAGVDSCSGTHLLAGEPVGPVAHIFTALTSTTGYLIY